MDSSNSNVSNDRQQDYVWCQEHNHLVHKDNVQWLIRTSNQTERDQENTRKQLDTMIAFSSGSDAPSYLPRKNINQNIKQGGFTEKPAPKNNNILPNVTETFLEFAGLR